MTTKEPKAKKASKPVLAPPNSPYEVGIDEVGRGPLFGPVYAAAVILPIDTFDFSLMKDSKKFSSPIARSKVADYIKTNATWWAVESISEKQIDEINILHATMAAMHKCLDKLPHGIPEKNKIEILVDGTYFHYYQNLKHTCVVAGDNTYASIAAASILAKVARDDFIQDLAKQHPFLDEYYDISRNKGYGTQKHMQGIATHGISEWHRLSFGPCKKGDCVPLGPPN